MNEKQAELETKDEIKIRVLAIGLQANDLLPLKDLLSTCDIQYLPADLNRLIKPLKEEPAFILCGKAIKGAPLDELGQLVRYAYRDVPIFLLCLSKEEQLKDGVAAIVDAFYHLKKKSSLEGGG